VTPLTSYDELEAERRKNVLILAFVPGLLLTICIMLVNEFAPDIPKIVKYEMYAAALVLGLAVTGPKLIRNTTHS